MSQFLYLVPTLTILVGALVLMFMSMYDKFNIKNYKPINPGITSGKYKIY